jgi:ribosomal protein S18 acetylase RimI-like enzyme
MKIDTFRHAVATDVGDVASLVNLAYRPSAGAAGWTHESDLVSGERVDAAKVAAMLDRQQSALLLGFADARLVACVHVEKEGGSSYIGMLAVDPALQTAGAGKCMLARAEEFARSAFGAVSTRMVVVSARPELLAFYQRRGYRKTGAASAYPLAAGFGVPMREGLMTEVLEKSFAA